MNNEYENLEQNLIGGILSEIDNRQEVITILGNNPAVFGVPKHQNLYKIILQSYKENKSFDLAELTKYGDHEAMNVGIDCITQVTSTTLSKNKAIVVKEQYIRRKYKQATIALNNVLSRTKSYTEDEDAIKKFIDNFETYQSELFQGLSVTSSNDVHKEFIKSLKEGKKDSVEIPISKMQAYYDGWQKSDLIIVGARPGMGKTVFATNMAFHAAKTNKPTVFFSLEMANVQLHKRIVSHELNVNATNIRKNTLTDQETLKIYEWNLQNTPLYFDDKSTELSEILNKARFLKKEKGLEMIVIDYLQLISVKGVQSKLDQVTQISRALKMLAKELEVPVICLSQLSRNVETRPIKRPMMSDLRDSGSIEQDADVVIFLYRPQYYGLKEWDTDACQDFVGMPTENQIEVITEKHRHAGGNARTVVSFIPHLQKIEDYNTQYTSYDIVVHDKLPAPKPASPEDAFMPF